MMLKKGQERARPSPDLLAATAAPAASATASTRAAAAASGATAWLGELDFDPASVELGTIQASDRIIGLLGRGHFNEPEAARSSGITVGHDACRLDGPDPGERFTKAIAGG